MPISKLKNRPIAITLGDPFGIGPEVIKKALQSRHLTKSAKFLVIGDGQIFSRYKISSSKNIELVDLGHHFGQKLKIGRMDTKAAQASLDYLEIALEYIKTKTVRALVTAPVCKEGIDRVLPHFIGHTEFLAQRFAVKNVGMMFVGPDIKTMIVTRHIPVKKLPAFVSQLAVVSTIQLTDWALKKYFSLKIPRIAICGLNPHAGEGGTIGNEEIKTILPAIRQVRQKGIKAFGPFSADTLFTPVHLKHYDAIVAMYHDQGLIPVKTLSFNRVVNLTVGLPFVRTSPAHGTAFDIAGKNMADPRSMVEALNLAARLSS